MRHTKYLLIFLGLTAYLSCKTSQTPIIKCNSEHAFTSNYEIKGDSEFLRSIISGQIESGVLGKEPMVVIDAVPYVKCNKGKIDELPITKSEISEISVLDAEQSILLYGKQANNGLILITSKDYEDKENDVNK